MKLYRSLFPWQFFADLIRVTDHQLGQIKAVRFVMGGVWVKEGGTWAQVEVTRETDDGMLLSMSSYDNTSTVSFWNTCLSVQDLEDYR